MTARFLPRSSFVLGLTLVLAACSDHPEYTADEAVAAVEVSGGGVILDGLATNIWNTGFNGAVLITDSAFNGPITSFQIVFRLLGTAAVVGSGWNGIISGPDASGNYTATNPDWLQFNPIQRGQTWDVGFNGSGTFSGSIFVSMKINGQTIPLVGDDPTPPIVSLASSAAIVTAAGSITLTATATDNVGVVRVEFFDGATLLGTDTTPPFTVTIVLTAADSGTHCYTARAFDAAGNTATTSALCIDVDILPTGDLFRANPHDRITAITPQ